MAESFPSEAYLEYRRRLVAASVTNAAVPIAAFIIVYLLIVLVTHASWSLGLLLPFAAELGAVGLCLWVVRGRLRSRPEIAVLATDFTFSAAIAVQLLLPHSTTSGVSLAICLKMLGSALFFPWGNRAQYVSVAVSICLYWAAFLASDRSFATSDFAHQAVAPLLAGLLAASGAASAERARRKLFMRDRMLQKSERDLRELLARVQESEARKSAVLESVPDAVVTIDETGKVLEFNPAAERIFGYRREEAIGGPLDKLIIPAAMREQYWLGIADHIATGRTTLLGKRRELTAVKKDGGELPVELILTRVEHEGPPMFTAVVSDLSERKRSEEHARQQQAELAHALRVATMGEMAAELAHEISQPLSSITAFAQGLIVRLQGGLDRRDELEKAAERIAGEAIRAGEVLRRQRDFLRRSAPRREPSDLNHLVREAAHLVEPDARRSNVAIRMVLDSRMPKLNIDPIQVEQVVLNLLRNGLEAITATDGQGVNELLIETSLQNGDARVAVRDSGCGLAPDCEQKIFQRFYSTKSYGLGMGLSISRSIIEEHGGSLKAGSNLDRGSTFTFILPVK
jgi:two-component system sensor kinase FixL